MRIPIYVAAALVATSVALLVLWSQQRRLLYFPEPDPGPPPAGWVEVTIPTDSGLQLSAWHRTSDFGDDNPIFVVFPGNGGNRAGRLAFGNALEQRGFDVLLVDYRGYGGNPGSPSEEGLADDARSAARVAATLAPGRPVVYVGESLGAAVATGLAVERPPDAMILLSPFTALADVGRHHYPWALGFLIWDKYPSLERFESGALDTVPVLVLAGTGDTIVPVAQSRSIAEAANAEWYEVEGVDHNDPAIRSAPAVVNHMVEFIEQSLNR